MLVNSWRKLFGDMKLKELAKQLDKRQICDGITKEEEVAAAADGHVIVFGSFSTGWKICGAYAANVSAGCECYGLQPNKDDPSIIMLFFDSNDGSGPSKAWGGFQYLNYEIHDCDKLISLGAVFRMKDMARGCKVPDDFFQAFRSYFLL